MNPQSKPFITGLTFGLLIGAVATFGTLQFLKNRPAPTEAIVAQIPEEKKQEAPAPIESPPKLLPQTSSPLKTCKTIILERSPAGKKQESEELSMLNNLITLTSDQISGLDMKKACVRVNGTPVKFQFFENKENQILIGSQPAPDLSVSIQACPSGMNCNQDCKVSKDTFLSAIGGDSDDQDLEVRSPSSAWNGKGDMSNEAEEKLDSVITDLKPAFSRTNKAKKKDFYSDWTLRKESRSCNIQVTKT